MKQELLDENRQARQLQGQAGLLQGYQGYLNACNAFIVLVNDILANDSPDEQRAARLTERQGQAKLDAAYARDNIYRILDDILDKRPPPYAPSLHVV